ncbi:unnamed protein product [Linum trigynum]|uniref:Uncharacterized protein n=1 Tax=Linum trigynum TaxID=586398 RepID=A0AAV2CCA2_9ROSI
MVGLKTKKASIASDSQPIGKSGADLTMLDQTKIEPTDLNPAHKPSSAKLIPPLGGGLSALGEDAVPRESNSIREHHIGKSRRVCSPPKKKKDTNLRVAKKSHGLRPGTGNGKRPQKKHSNSSHRKAVEELLVQLQYLPPAGAPILGTREDNVPMNEITEPQTTGTEGDQASVDAAQVENGAPLAESAN